MFTTIQTYIYQVQNDPRVRQRFVATIVLGVIITGMISLIIFVNTRDRTVRVGGNQVTITQSYRAVTTNDFDISQGLSQEYGIPVIDAVNIDHNKDTWAYINKNAQLTVNGEVVDNSPQIVPRSVYATEAGVIVNGIDSTYLYQNSQTSPFVDKVYSVIPALITQNTGKRDTEGYMFLLANAKQALIFETKDVFDSNARSLQVAQLNLKDTQRFAELHSFNNEPYIITYSDITRTGTIEVWQITANNKLVRSLRIEGVVSSMFGESGFVYTIKSSQPTELSLYETHVVDYVASVLGTDMNIDILPRIAQAGIYGTLYAQRCTFDSTTSISCLLKARKTQSTDYTQQDRIVRYDFIKDTLEFPYQNVFFSGERMMYTEEGDAYIIGQQNHILYRLDKARE